MFDIVRYFRQHVIAQKSPDHQSCFLRRGDAEPMGHALQLGVLHCPECDVPWPDIVDASSYRAPHFDAFTLDGCVRVWDKYLEVVIDVANELLENIYFDLPNYYSHAVQRAFASWHFDVFDLQGELVVLFGPVDQRSSPQTPVQLALGVVGVQSAARGADRIPALQWNAALPRDFSRLIPEPAVIVVLINGQPVRALLDSGSLSDFMSAKLAHQLGIQAFELAKPLPVHLAVQGSHAKVNSGCRASLEYQSIKSEHYFDIINLLNYDLILGTPFLFQHKVGLSLNPMAVVVGSIKLLPIEGKQRTPDESSVNPDKIYSWRPSRCPDVHRASWIEKRDAYLKCGRWRMTNARNTSPMLLLTKPGTGIKGIPPRLRVVYMEGILRRLARHPYRSLIDGKDAYEQIRVEPEQVERTAMTTPDGNMTLMNHLFGPYVGVFMDVYLDDIAVYSDTLADHKKHVRLIIDILKREKLYLSATKLHFLCEEMKVLGRIVDSRGIRMDPDKVDTLMNWKVPTNKELLRGFLGSVGYLADDITTVRIPMGILASMTGPATAFRWDFTHQRAFDEIKRLVHAHCEHCRRPLDYAKDASPIWLVTDRSHGGVAGVVCQGEDFRRAHVAAFFSAKLTSAQPNYPVHEIEMLAGVEAMQRHRTILLGCHFTWVTDHKGLVHLLKQRNLSGRQARWLEKISEFDFEIEYVPGVENVLADALSRIYSNDQLGTVRAASEYVTFDADEDGVPLLLANNLISAPVMVDLEAMAVAAGLEGRRHSDVLVVQLCHELR
ncbi:hypothetical protein ACG7TL_007230 [Trametes sanguinea]